MKIPKYFSNQEQVSALVVDSLSNTAIQDLFQSAMLGAFLMAITVLASVITQGSNENKTKPSDLVLNSANVLFLCFGMTGVMLLVNNNIARAFAIGAAIALVRFRIKVSDKIISMSLFYGVLVGMACGVNQIQIGYVICVCYALLQFVVVVVAKIGDKTFATNTSENEKNPAARTKTQTSKL